MASERYNPRDVVKHAAVSGDQFGVGWHGVAPVAVDPARVMVS